MRDFIGNNPGKAFPTGERTGKMAITEQGSVIVL
jgi:hypothetical protein